jgi:hypothetical protein
MPADIVLGIVTVIMALLGAAVSLHPPESLHAPGRWRVKVCYATAFTILGTIAIICVIKQSKETALANQNLTTALGDLGRSTGDIARITGLNTQLQKKLLGQDARISKLAEESFKTITGAGSFPYVVPQPAAYPGPVPLFVWDHGKYMLTGVTLTIRRSNDFSFVGNPLDVEILHPGWGKALSAVLIPKPDPNTGVDIYLIEVYTQSDFFTEVVHFRKSKDGKYWASRFWVQQAKFGERTERPTPLPKSIPIPKNGSVSFTVYDRSKWSDEAQDDSPKN